MAIDFSGYDQELAQAGIDPEQAGRLLNFMRPRVAGTAAAQPAMQPGMLNFGPPRMPKEAIPGDVAPPAINEPPPRPSLLNFGSAQPSKPGPPTRAQFPVEQMPTWKKLLGAAFSTLAGMGNPNAAGETARAFFGAPEARAEQQYQDAQQEYERQEAAGKEAEQERNIESEIGYRGAQAANLVNKDQEALAKLGMKRDENGGIVEDPESEVTKRNAQRATDSENLAKFRQAQVELENANLALRQIRNDPSSPQYQLLQQRLMAAQQAHDLAAKNLQLRQQEFDYRVNGPTTQTRDMGQQAKAVSEMVPGILKQIDELAGQIGPAIGRWNRLLVDRGGSDYPEFAGLDEDLQLLASGIARAHFGARGAASATSDFKKYLTQAQSPEDLKARINHANEWMKGYAKNAQGQGANPQSGNGGGPQKKWNARTGRYEQER